MNNIDPYYVAVIGIFLGVLLAFDGVRQVLSRDAEQVKSRRIRMIKAGANRGEVLQLLRVPDGGWLARVPLLSDLPRRLRVAGLAISPGAFVLVCVAAGVVAYLLATHFLSHSYKAAAAVAGALMLPFAYVEISRRKRLDKLVTQLPDALDLMARGLRVGHPLNATIASVANEMADPIATEFGIVVDQISYGDDLVTALTGMSRRVDQEDLHYFAVSVGIQHGTGGNLARVLKVMAQVIRDRATMRRKVQAISAEGRGSMWILSALPVLIFVVVNVLTPDFYGAIKDDPLYEPIMIGIVALVVLNFLVLRRLVNFRF